MATHRSGGRSHGHADQFKLVGIRLEIGGQSFIQDKVGLPFVDDEKAAVPLVLFAACHDPGEHRVLRLEHPAHETTGY